MNYVKPTDEENAARRRAIAQRQFAIYQEVYLWALGRFGPGWIPTGRWMLVDKEEEERVRKARGPDNPHETATPAAVVYSVDHERLGRKFFLRRKGKSVEVPGYHEGFGEMLDEPHPTITLKNFKGVTFRPHRYSLCWAGFEPDYRPATAEQLAKRRGTRERKKAEMQEAQRVREEEAARERMALWTWAEAETRKEV